MKIIIIFLTFFINYSSSSVPSFIKICGRRNPNLDKCIIDSVYSLKERLADGIPELHVPGLKKLKLPEKLLLSDTPELKAFAHEIVLHDVYNFVINNLHFDLEKKTLDIDLTVKNLKLTGEYDVNAKIIVELKGKGPIEIYADDVRGKLHLHYELVESKKGTKMYFTSMTTKLTIRDYKSTFIPRENSNEKFSEAVHTLFNTNRQEIIAGLLPNLEKSVSNQVLTLANNICKHFTAFELLPDRE